MYSSCPLHPVLPVTLSLPAHALFVDPRASLSHHPPFHPTSACRRTLGSHCNYCTCNRTPRPALHCPLTATSARPAYCASSAHSTRLAASRDRSDSRPKADNIIASSACLYRFHLAPVALGRSSAGHTTAATLHDQTQQYIFWYRTTARCPETTICDRARYPHNQDG